jgi:Protein of unknown function (DUF3000)
MRPAGRDTGSQAGGAALRGPADGQEPAPAVSPAEEAFRRALAGLEDGLAEQRTLRPELTFEDEPAPRKLAPFATAVGVTVAGPDEGSEVAWGRFVLLYDPEGQHGWGGPARIIAHIRADLEPEIAADPMIGEVGWSWLIEALDARAAGYQQPSGTVTRVVTEGFGAKQDEPVATEFELRASWSPAWDAVSGGSPAAADFALDGHVAAWCDALCAAAGLPPVIPGVSALRPRTRRQP